jgi:RNA polymerase sigma factor (sigma-70 family)
VSAEGSIEHRLLWQSIAADRGHWLLGGPPIVLSNDTRRAPPISVSTTCSDEELMGLYRGGDQAAFRRLYDRYRGPLIRFVSRMALDPSDVEEIVQETWMAVIRGRERYISNARFVTYLFSIARRRSMDRWRRRGRQPEVDGPDKKALSFDNMDSHPVTGTTGWTRYEIVLDAPPDSVDIAFGFFLKGSGKVWGDGFKLEKVDATVPVTFAGPPLPRAPVNLDFEGTLSTQTTDRTLEYAQGPGPYVFDCDAPWGKTKDLNIRAPGDKLRITGSIRFLYTGLRPTEWVPAASVALIQPDQQSSARLVALVRNNITNIWLALGLSRYRIVQLESNGAVIPFGLTLDQSGKATASIGGSTSPASFQIASSIDHVTLSCSTTHVRFTNVTIVALK